MTLLLQNRIAIVTGASKGIGRAIALGFAREGAILSLCARDGEQAESVATEIRAQGGRATAMSADVGVEADVNRLVEETLNAYGRIDILVANAGVIAPAKRVTELSIAEWKRHLDVNLTGVLLCNQAVLPHMIQQNYGRIQNMGSGVEMDPIASMAAYAASKGAVNSMTRVIATETARHNIKVNVHYPGSLRTDLNPHGEGKPEDAVPCAIYLASLPDDGPTGRTFQMNKEIKFSRREVARPSECVMMIRRSIRTLRSGLRNWRS